MQGEEEMILLPLLMVAGFAIDNTWHVEAGGASAFIVPSNRVEVVDGDTLKVQIPGLPNVFGKDLLVRISGIDAPELHSKNTCERMRAIQARDYLSNLIAGTQWISIEDVKRDKYFRLLGSLFIDGKTVSYEMLRKGYAVPYYGKTKPAVDWCSFKCIAGASGTTCAPVAKDERVK